MQYSDYLDGLEDILSDRRQYGSRFERIAWYNDWLHFQLCALRQLHDNANVKVNEYAAALETLFCVQRQYIVFKQERQEMYP